MNNLKKRLEIHFKDIKHYSLLLLIYEDSLIFESRSNHITHAGEICFPGGKCENDESYEDAAIREACEELNVKKEDIEIIGQLSTYVDPHGRIIHPFVGQIKNYHQTFNKDEVAHILSISIDELINKTPLLYQTYIETHLDDTFPYDLIPQGKNYPFLKKKRMMYFYQYKQEVIWGLTAEILHQFLELYK